MPAKRSSKRSPSIPKMTRHKATGQARVRIDGRDFYLGRYGTEQSRQAYERIITEWLAAGRKLADARTAPSQTVTEIVVTFVERAEGRYSTEAMHQIKAAMRPLRRVYGDSPASTFGPKSLKTVRAEFVEAGLSRITVNGYFGWIRGVFRKAASEELIPAETHRALETVEDLRAGRDGAAAGPPRRPMDVAIVEKTLPYMPALLADACRVILSTGARPSEVLGLTPAMIDTRGEM